MVRPIRHFVTMLLAAVLGAACGGESAEYPSAETTLANTGDDQAWQQPVAGLSNTAGSAAPLPSAAGVPAAGAPAMGVPVADASAASSPATPAVPSGSQTPAATPVTPAASTQPSTDSMGAMVPAPTTPTVATLFWLDINGNRVYRSDERDFSARETLVARTNTAPDGVAVDVEGGKIYWSNMGSLLGTGGGTLQRANLDGSGVETIVPAGVARTPKQMQIDTVNGHVYWCDREGAKVWRAGLDGSSPEILVSGHGFLQLVGVALDIPARVFYFGDRNGRKILRANFDMPASESDDNRTDIEELFVFDRGAMPIDLDLDLENQMLYWTDRDLGTVNRANMDVPAGETSSTRTDIEVLVTGLRDPIGISLDHEDQKLYYAELGGNVYQASMDGTGAMRIANSGSATGVAIARIPE